MLVEEVHNRVVHREVVVFDRDHGRLVLGRVYLVPELPFTDVDRVFPVQREARNGVSCHAPAVSSYVTPAHAWQFDLPPEYGRRRRGFGRLRRADFPEDDRQELPLVLRGQAGVVCRRDHRGDQFIEPRIGDVFDDNVDGPVAIEDRVNNLAGIERDFREGDRLALVRAPQLYFPAAWGFMGEDVAPLAGLRFS